MTQLVKPEQRAKSIRDLLEKHKSQIAMALPKHLTPDRLIRVALTAINRTPLLLEADQRSLFAAVIQAAQLGLEPDGALGMGYLIPFRNRKLNRIDVQFLPGYRGLLQLVRNSGELSTVEVRAVHAKDTFRFHYGITPKLEHIPWDPGAAADPSRYANADEYEQAVSAGPLIAVYGIARLKDGGVQWEVMRRHEVDAIRARSQSRDSGPWVTDYEPMSKKTVLKRLSKLLPMSIEAATAIKLDDQAEGGEPQDLELPASVTTDDDAPPAGSALAQLTATLTAGKPTPQTVPADPATSPPTPEPVTDAPESYPPIPGDLPPPLKAPPPPPVVEDEDQTPPAREIPFDLGASELPPEAPPKKGRK